MKRIYFVLIDPRIDKIMMARTNYIEFFNEIYRMGYYDKGVTHMLKENDNLPYVRMMTLDEEIEQWKKMWI